MEPTADFSEQYLFFNALFKTMNLTISSFQHLPGVQGQKAPTFAFLKYSGFEGQVRPTGDLGKLVMSEGYFAPWPLFHL